MPCDLTGEAVPAKIHSMSYSFLVFDFGGSEDVAQQARHRIDGWKQGFRLDKKIQVKFERKEPEGKTDGASAPAPKAAKSGGKAKAKLGAKSNSGGESASKS